MEIGNNHKPLATTVETASGTEHHVAKSALLLDESAALMTPIMPRTKTQRTTMRLDQLRSNPLQMVYYPECSLAEDEQLDADMAANGQRDPIHVMPPGNHAGLPAYTILDGHRRAESLRRLGKTNAIIVIRWDLLETDSSTLEGIFLRFNVNRRQLDPLSVAINVKRQTELDNGGQLNSAQLQALDQTLKGILGGCTRNIQRYLHAADAPLEIQAALRRGDITLTVASQVGGLNLEVQREIVDAIDRVTDRKKIRKIIEKYIDKYGVRPGKPLSHGYTSRAVAIIEGIAERLAEVNPDQLHGPTLAKHLPSMQKIQLAMVSLIKASERRGAGVSELTHISGHAISSENNE